MNPVAAPWQIPLSIRLNGLAVSKGKQNVVWIYEKEDTSTFRYRVYNMCQALKKSTSIAPHFFFEKEIETLIPRMKNVDLLIISRVRWSAEIDRLFNETKKRKLKVLFDVDDLVFSVEAIPLLMNTLNQPFITNAINDWFGYAARLWFTASKTDGTIGTNDALKDELSIAFQKPSHIIPNFLNEEQIAVSAPLFEKKQHHKKDTPFTIGYFSGTPSHINDFRVAAPELREFMIDYPDTRFFFVGFLELPEALTPFVKEERITSHPLVDFLTLQEKIASVDVNIVPLVENRFTNCKSELKFFEAAIVGTETLASPICSYKNSICHRETGFLVKEGEWYDTLKVLYQKTYDPLMKERAQKAALQAFSPDVKRLDIERVVEKTLK